MFAKNQFSIYLFLVQKQTLRASRTKRQPRPKMPRAKEPWWTLPNITKNQRMILPVVFVQVGIHQCQKNLINKKRTKRKIPPTMLVGSAVIADTGTINSARALKDSLLRFLANQQRRSAKRNQTNYCAQMLYLPYRILTIIMISYNDIQRDKHIDSKPRPLK